MANIKEVDLFDPVKDWLGEAYNTKVYPEVEYKGDRADVVATTDDGILTVVELKTSLSIELISQAVNWLDQANYVYVGVPQPAKSFHPYALELLRREGIGLLAVDFNSYYGVTCKRRLDPTPNQTPKGGLRSKLSDLHLELDIKGGQSGGGYLTDYKTTIIMVQRYLTEQGNKWVTIDDILKNCKTHYANPKQSLVKALREFEGSWCDSKVFRSGSGSKLHFKHRGGLSANN